MFGFLKRNLSPSGDEIVPDKPTKHRKIDEKKVKQGETSVTSAVTTPLSKSSNESGEPYTDMDITNVLDKSSLGGSDSTNNGSDSDSSSGDSTSDSDSSDSETDEEIDEIQQHYKTVLPDDTPAWGKAILSCFREDVKKIFKKHKSLSKKVSNVSSELKSNKKSLQKLHKRVARLESCNGKLSEENIELREKMLDLEYRQRRSNLVFEGIKDGKGETNVQLMSKFKLFVDDETQVKILKTSSPYYVKTLSHRVKKYDHATWKEHDSEVAFTGILAKFNQNEVLANILKATGEATIAESSTDDMWGTGVYLKHDDAVHQQNWKQPGIMSQVLSRVRELLK